MEQVIKYADRAQAERIYNIPYTAIEESLVNAIYHRSYEIREPVEVRILPEKLIIKSFPGPERSVNIKDLQNGHGASQQYRNRRIGDFLKELDLTEGRGTGIPKILKAMKANGSPKPTFETDEDHTFFLTILPMHLKTIKPEKENKVDYRLESRLESMSIRILKILQEKELSRKEIAIYLGHKAVSGALNKGIKLLLDHRYIEHTIHAKRQSRLQKYRITKEGQLHLKEQKMS